MFTIPNHEGLRRWFAGLVENAFQANVGLCDPTLLDYLVNLLTEFIHVERISLLADGSGRRIWRARIPRNLTMEQLQHEPGGGIRVRAGSSGTYGYYGGGYYDEGNEWEFVFDPTGSSG